MQFFGNCQFAPDGPCVQPMVLVDCGEGVFLQKCLRHASELKEMYNNAVMIDEKVLVCVR